MDTTPSLPDSIVFLLSVINYGRPKAGSNDRFGAVKLGQAEATHLLDLIAGRSSFASRFPGTEEIVLSSDIGPELYKAPSTVLSNPESARVAKAIQCMRDTWTARPVDTGAIWPLRLVDLNNRKLHVWEDGVSWMLLPFGSEEWAQTVEVRRDDLLLALLAMLPDEALAARFSEFAQAIPHRALDILEGTPLVAGVSPRPVPVSLPPEALAPLLTHPSREVRERAIVAAAALGRTEDQATARPPSSAENRSI